MTRKELIDSPEYWIASMRITVLQSIEQSGMTRQQLADKSGINRSYVDRLLSGTRELNFNTATKLLLATGKVPKIVIEDLKDQK